MNSFDSRVRYTRMIIEKCFLELLREKPVSKITVTELCEAAQINRATFYKHYLDIPDLLEKLEDQLFQQIREAFQGTDPDMKTFLTKMLRCTCLEQERYMALGSDNGDPNLMTKTLLVCYEYAYPLLSQNISNLQEDERQMLYQYISHGSGAVLKWWISNGMRESPEEIARFILSISTITADGVHEASWQSKFM